MLLLYTYNIVHTFARFLYSYFLYLFDLFVFSIYIKAFCKLQVAKAGLVWGEGALFSPLLPYIKIDSL